MRIPWKDRIIAAWHCLCGRSVALGIESEGGISIRNDRGGMVAYCAIVPPKTPEESYTEIAALNLPFDQLEYHGFSITGNVVHDCGEKQC